MIKGMSELVSVQDRLAYEDEQTCQPCTCRDEHGKPRLHAHYPELHDEWCAWRRQEERMAAWRKTSTGSSEGHWTYELPTEPGWYWYQESPVKEPAPMLLPESLTWTRPGTGRWSGPIPVPMAHEAWRPK